MEDRIEDLKKIPKDQIRKEGFGWYLDGENHDYLSADLIFVGPEEVRAFKEASTHCNNLFVEAFKYIRKNNLWRSLEIVPELVPMIEYSWDNAHPLLLTRYDFAGGIDDLPLKLIELNADTCTLVPESFYIQNWIHEPIRLQTDGQFNQAYSELVNSFQNLRLSHPSKDPTLLLTSLGYIEDKLNLQVIAEAAQEAGFMPMYSDLEHVVFAEDGMYLEVEDGYMQYNFMYKLVPWEFIMNEEPDLMNDLTELVLADHLIVLNPAFSLVHQAKNLLPFLYELFPNDPYLLPTYKDKYSLRNEAHVVKRNFGRLGENIEIITSSGNVVEKTDAVENYSQKIYQQYASLYKDEDGDRYQPSVYCVHGTPACLSFRRKEGFIMDEDIDFVSHAISQGY